MSYGKENAVSIKSATVGRNDFSNGADYCNNIFNTLMGYAMESRCETKPNDTHGNVTATTSYAGKGINAE